MVIDFRKKTWAMLARRNYGAELQNGIQKFRMFVRPSSRAYFRPNLSFFRFDDAHGDMTIALIIGKLDRPVKDAADLDRPVVAPTKQIQRGDASERAYFMKHRRVVIAKKALNRVQRAWARRPA